MPVDITENNKQYEISQKQRAIERSIRKIKRTLSALDGAVSSCDDEVLKRRFKNQFERHSSILKTKEKRLTKFCSSNGIYKQNDRVRVAGFGKSVSQKAIAGSKRNFVKKMKSYGIENPPKSLDKFEKMKYTNPPEYNKISAYINSVKTGYISPLVGYDYYSNLYDLIDSSIVGMTTSNGIKITGQSNHFVERVIGVMKDPKTEKLRLGVKLEDIQDAIINGKPRKPKFNLGPNDEPLYNPDGSRMRSQLFISNYCAVSINIDTGNLIQCNPV